MRGLGSHQRRSRGVDPDRLAGPVRAWHHPYSRLQKVGVWIQGDLCWCRSFDLFWDHRTVIFQLSSCYCNPQHRRLCCELVPASCLEMLTRSRALTITILVPHSQHSCSIIAIGRTYPARHDGAGDPSHKEDRSRVNWLFPNMSWLVLSVGVLVIRAQLFGVYISNLRTPNFVKLPIGVRHLKEFIPRRGRGVLALAVVSGHTPLL